MSEKKLVWVTDPTRLANPADDDVSYPGFFEPDALAQIGMEAVDAFDAAPEPRRIDVCTIHNAEYSCETARGEKLCWLSSERGHANPCVFVTLYAVPADSQPPSETT